MISVLPDVAMGVEVHLMRATNLKGAGAAMLGFGEKAAKAFVDARPSRGLGGSNDNTLDDKGDEELSSLLIVVRTATQ